MYSFCKLFILMLIALIVIIVSVQAFPEHPEQSVFHFQLTQHANMMYFHRTLHKGTVISVAMECEKFGTKQVSIEWLLRQSECLVEYPNVDLEEVSYYMRDPLFQPFKHLDYSCVKYLIVDEAPACDDHYFHFTFHAAQPKCQDIYGYSNVSAVEVTGVKGQREVKHTSDTNFFSNVTDAWEDGIYLFALRVKSPVEFNISVEVNVKHGDEYLSVKDRPFLLFYGSMCVVHVFYSVMWLIISFCYWKEMLRIQYFIGLVIFAGLLEKGLLFGEYYSLNQTGQSVLAVMVVADSMSQLRLALTRMLIILLSLGFGIVRPRLGLTLYKVVGMGAMYFLLAIAHTYMYMGNKALSGSSDSKVLLVAVDALLVLVDAVIFFWTCSRIKRTLRTLHLGGNVVKLSLYKHFTICFFIYILVSTAYIIWSIYEFRSSLCSKAWKAVWLDDAYWHLFSSIFFLVIIILWRPSLNQRYALDDSDEKDEPTKYGVDG